MSADHAHIVFGGNTKPFQHGFVALKINGQSHKAQADDQYAEYFRVIFELNITNNDECLAYLEKVFGASCLCSSPVVIRKKQTTHVMKKLSEVLDAIAKWQNVRVEV